MEQKPLNSGVKASYKRQKRNIHRTQMRPSNSANSSVKLLVWKKNLVALSLQVLKNQSMQE
jgi:hypothetical protein